METKQSGMSRHRLKAEMTERKLSRLHINWFKWVGIVPILIFVGFLSYEFIVQLPKAKQAQSELEVEFSLISALPKATRTRYEASHKTSQALVDAAYIINADPVEIFDHYDKELKSQGWQSFGMSDMRDWGSDLGGASAYYCKGKYSAQLQYAGQQASYGWTYAFSLSWGLGDCRTKGGLAKQSIPESLYLMGFGSFFMILAGYHARTAWTKSAEEYIQWLYHQKKSKWARFWLSVMPKSYALWNDRVLSILGMLLGGLAALAGTYSLWRNIFGG